MATATPIELAFHPRALRCAQALSLGVAKVHACTDALIAKLFGNRAATYAKPITIVAAVYPDHHLHRAA